MHQFEAFHSDGEHKYQAILHAPCTCRFLEAGTQQVAATVRYMRLQLCDSTAPDCAAVLRDLGLIGLWRSLSRDGRRSPWIRSELKLAGGVLMWIFVHDR